MEIHPHVLLPVARLRPFPASYKRPFSAADRQGLADSLSAWGFSGVLNVAAEPGGFYVVLDGNSRLDELLAQKAESAPCVVHAAMAHDAPDAARLREDFVLSYDAKRKPYDRPRLVERLAQREAGGEDLSALSRMCPVKNLSGVLAALRAAAPEGAAAAEPAAAPDRQTMILYGPKAVMDAVRRHLGEVREEMASSSRVLATLERARAHIDIEDEAFLAAFLAAVAHYLEP